MHDKNDPDARLGDDVPVGEEPVDVVIVGAGFTGLAAALELSAQGVSCRILESEPIIEPLRVTVRDWV
ncbi:FAD-dependent oxidoreductase [Micromonospora sp. LOL_023]|uniref:FAD-dependent oxidoreductase n=1 Tax=Micromonospora sp. LOL_023 TaxID=3345418 RepID=UPI003A8AF305